jgi:deoxyribose-phosphate aldolase
MNLDLSELLARADAYDLQLPELLLPEGHPGDRPIASWIDHTLLKPEATPQQVAQLCDEARRYAFASVCVNPVYVPLAHELLAGSPVMVCSVVGFPLGATLAEAKAEEARLAIMAGAQEVDMVLQVGLLKGGEYSAVADDIRGIVEVAHGNAALVKVILETALLTRHEKILGCLISQAEGADFVKTSTGFGPGGATVEDVTLMRQVVGPQMGVKAAGGIRSLADAQAMLQAGATRLGSSSGVKIVEEARKAA